jgi:hypothetical protein
VAPAALALLVAIHVLVDSIARARGVGVVTLGVVWRYAGWAGSPVAFILLGLLALAARRELARDAAGAAPPERGRGWRAAGEGLATLRAAVAWRIVLAVGGVVLIRVAMALDAPDAARILCWAMFLAGAVTALVILGALVSIGRMPEATGLAVVVGVLGLLGLILDGAATVLTARMLIKPTGFWGGGLHEALEAARILPTISVGAGVLGLATSASTFGLLGALARTVGDEDARARAVGGAAMAVLAGLFLTVSQASALASRAFVPLLALSALGGLAIAIAVLVRFLGLTRTLGETLRG